MLVLTHPRMEMIADLDEVERHRYPRIDRPTRSAGWVGLGLEEAGQVAVLAARVLVAAPVVSAWAGVLVVDLALASPTQYVEPLAATL